MATVRPVRRVTSRGAALIAAVALASAGCGGSSGQTAGGASSQTASTSTPSPVETSSSTSTAKSGKKRSAASGTGAVTTPTQTATSTGGLLVPGAPPRNIQRKLNKACGQGMRLPRLDPAMSVSQLQSAASEALASIAHTGNTVQRLAAGHPTSALIGLALSYRELGGLYAAFTQDKPKSRKTFDATAKRVETAKARTKRLAARAGIANCGPR